MPRLVRSVVAVVAVATLAACGGEGGKQAAGTPSTTTAGARAGGGAAAKTAKAAAACGSTAPAQGDSTARVEPVGDGKPAVRAGVYPVPSYAARLWSQWGQGALLPDGRYVSAVGDHCGRDGNSFLFVYDPAKGSLVRRVDVADVVGHEPGAWGYGKVHAAAVPMGDGNIYFSTYWGSSRRLEFGNGYEGDVLFRYDTASGKVERVGVPAPRHGVPSLAGWAKGGLLYGEAVDPQAEDKAGLFFVYDIKAKKTIFTSDEARHAGFRSILVTKDGRALFSAGERRLWQYDPDAKKLSLLDGELPGDHLRAVTAPAPDGTVYGVTDGPRPGPGQPKEEAVMFALRPSGAIETLGPAGGYTASLALDADAGRIYYLPDAHGRAWEEGTPLMAMDVKTGKRTEVLKLNDVIGAELGLTLGGTYNVVLDQRRHRLFVGLNAGDTNKAFGKVALAVVELP